MRTLIVYSTAPEADRFAPATVEQLKAIRSEIMDAEESSHQTEWSRGAWEADRKGIETALALAAQGTAVLVAQDEDGYYFGTE